MKTASADPARARASNASASALRAPTSGPSWAISSAPLRGDREPQHPDLAREREHDDRQRGEAEQRGAEADRQPALGASARCAGAAAASANAAASSAARPADAVPDAPARAEAPARRARRGRQRSRATCTARAPAMNSAAARRGGVEPGGDGDAEHELDGDQRRPHAAARRGAVDAVRGQRRPRGGAAGELQARGSEQHEPQDETDHDRDH